jgi:hypothetical protein
MSIERYVRRVPRRLCRAFLTLGFLATVSTLSAQQQPIPLRPLGRIVSTSKELLGNIGGVRALSDGRVLANDRVGHRVVLFDSTLAAFTTIADTTSGTAKAYGAAAGAIFPYGGDSSVFADPASLSLLIIDPAGKIVRTVSAPLGPGGALGYLVGPAANIGVDGKGNLSSRWTWAARNAQALLTTLPTNGSGGNVRLAYNDSALIVRANFLTKKRDTIATVNIGGQRADLVPGGPNS